MKNVAQKKSKGQDFNILTANVKHPAIAKDILATILVDAKYKETTLDSLTMLLEAFGTQETLTGVKDLADELQHFLFTQSVECDDAVRKYVEKIKTGKEYKTDTLHLLQVNTDSEVSQ